MSKKTEKYMGRIETETIEKMEEIAAAQHRTVSSVIRQALAEWLADRKSNRIKTNQ